MRYQRHSRHQRIGTELWGLLFPSEICSLRVIFTYVEGLNDEALMRQRKTQIPLLSLLSNWDSGVDIYWLWGQSTNSKDSKTGADAEL